MIGRRYTTDNIYAVGEWAIQRLKADTRAGLQMDEEVADIADWCTVWLENDPRDNGGDGWPRRQMRREWPQIWAKYRELAQ